jgi:hypothetical protein
MKRSTKKLTTKDFIKKATVVHKNKYSYNKVKYKNNKTKIIITCIKHGDFKQSPADHLKGCGCRKCVGLNPLNTKQFIIRANETHNNKYDYSNAIYKNSRTKIEITCNVHGSFWQKANSHLQGTGCPECNGGKPHTKSSFIKVSKSIHHNKYDYSLVKYKDNKTKVKIKCKQHGVFEQTPHHHMHGHGCEKCAIEYRALLKRRTVEVFISEANKVHHNKYDYSLVEYKGSTKKVKIKCKKHGIFEQAPNNHINQYQGCPECCVNNKSKSETIWLDSKRISSKNRNVVLVVNGKKYNVDAYVPRSKTIYEFYGDYWHGNPDVFSPRKMNKRSKKTFGALYKATMKREKELIAAGFKVISIWENDWWAEQ